MSETEPKPVVKRADDVTCESVTAPDRTSKGVIPDAPGGAPKFARRRFVLDPGAPVPERTNEVEHEQYVLSGTHAVSIDNEGYEASAGDSLLVPASAVHWCRNESEEAGSFLRAMPNGDDSESVGRE